MKKNFVVPALVLFLMTAPAAYALTYSIPPLPGFPDSSWDVGSSVTYKVAISEGEDQVSFKTRIAIIESLTDNATNQKLYRIEMGFSDINGLTDDLNQFFIENYGELPKTIRLNMLIPKYDFLKILTDPSKVYKDFTEPGFIRKLYFQYNTRAPYDVDTNLVTSFLLPVAASELLGVELPENFVSARNIGVSFVQDSELFTTELGDGVTTTDAGTFDGKMYTYTCNESGGPSGTIFISGELPIVSFVTYTGNWTGYTAPANALVELISLSKSGASTEISGTPVLLDLNALIFGMN
ncbi:MAG TPA: hypothetical protein ENN67_06735 [Firmicutes bacterium]|nr:hypothetical protein [Bacillota bacterium]